MTRAMIDWNTKRRCQFQNFRVVYRSTTEQEMLRKKKMMWFLLFSNISAESQRNISKYDDLWLALLAPPLLLPGESLRD